MYNNFSFYTCLGQKITLGVIQIEFGKANLYRTGLEEYGTTEYKVTHTRAEKSKRTNYAKQTSGLKSDLSINNSISRVKNMVLSNKWDYRFNMSVNDNIDIKEFMKTFTQTIKNTRRKYKVKFDYLLVYNYRGNSIDFLGVASGIDKRMLDDNGFFASYLRNTGNKCVFRKLGKNGITTMYNQMTKMLNSVKIEKNRKKYKFNHPLFFASQGLSTGELIQTGLATMPDDTENEVPKYKGKYSDIWGKTFWFNNLQDAQQYIKPLEQATESEQNEEYVGFFDENIFD